MVGRGSSKSGMELERNTMNFFRFFRGDDKCIIIKKDDRLVAVYPVDSLLSFVYFEK